MPENMQKSIKLIGNILPFNPQDYRNSVEMKSLLGYGEGPLIICSVGGTAIGTDLLEIYVRVHIGF